VVACISVQRVSNKFFVQDADFSPVIAAIRSKPLKPWSEVEVTKLLAF